MRSNEVIKRLQEAFGSYARGGFYSHVKRGNILPYATMSWRPGKTANLYHPDDVEIFIEKTKTKREKTVSK